MVFLELPRFAVIMMQNQNVARVRQHVEGWRLGSREDDAILRPRVVCAKRVLEGCRPQEVTWQLHQSELGS